MAESYVAEDVSIVNQSMAAANDVRVDEFIRRLTDTLHCEHALAELADLLAQRDNHVRTALATRSIEYLSGEQCPADWHTANAWMMVARTLVDTCDLSAVSLVHPLFLARCVGINAGFQQISQNVNVQAGDELYLRQVRERCVHEHMLQHDEGGLRSGGWRGW
jgi:hypothetical protein